jgi:OOP family OmpA-OmpF porin
MARPEFAELRGLLLGPEQDDIRKLKERLSHAHTAEQISHVLAEAVRLASQKNRKLRTALQPVVEQSIRASVRCNPGILGDALWPLIGDAVAKRVASALRRLTESLQEMHEQSFTARSVMWRFEALRSGKPFGEIVLVRSLLYRVERVLLIHRETGVMLAERSLESSASTDGDLISAMLTAIHDFVKDSFGEATPNVVEAIETGELVIWVQQRSHAVLAALIRGTPPKALRATFETVLDQICATHQEALANFGGNVTCFRDAERDLAACFLGQGSHAKRSGKLYILWAIATVLAILTGVWFAYSLNHERRWKNFVAQLSRQPGIVVASSGKRGGEYFVSGLRDPLAADPQALLKTAAIGGRVHFEWQSFICTDEALARVRSLQEGSRAVEARKIYFATNAADIPLDQLGILEDTAGRIRELFSSAARLGENVEIEVVGHTDDSGPEERNAQLAGARAEKVAAALTSLGISRNKLQTRSVGSQDPTATGVDDSHRAFNRYVSFVLHIGKLSHA